LEQYSEQAGKSVTGIELDAYKSIMSYDWPGNTDELKVVIRRAVSLVRGGRLTPEDILIGMAPQVTGRLSFNLLKLDRVRQLFQSSAFPDSAQLVAAFFIMLIIFLGFFGSQTSGFNASLELAWGLWEPLVVLSCILAAAVWCAVCPIGALSSLISRKYGLSRNIPSFIRNYGVYLSAVGLGFIFLSEVVFNMLFSPRATAGLILSITLPAVMLALIYRRRVWCRFLCPLGKLVGFLSRCSFLELRANNNICNNDCTENSCYVGHKGREGCPVFEAPFALNSNQNCIMCGNCIKNCSNQSPALNLRVPGQELWNFRKPDLTMALLGPLLMGTQLFRGLEKGGYFHYGVAVLNQKWLFYTAFMAISIFLAFVFVKTAGRVVFDALNTTPREKSGLMGYAFVPLVVAFELGFHFERLISRGGQLLPTLGRQLGFNWVFLGANIGPWLVKACQILLILIGVLAARAVLKRLLRSRLQTAMQHLAWQQHGPIWLLGAVYIGLFWTG
jgi:polyferredoxin